MNLGVGRADVGYLCSFCTFFQTADLCPLQQFIEATILFCVPLPIAVMVSLSICCIPLHDGSSKTPERNLVEVELGIFIQAQRAQGLMLMAEHARLKNSENKKENIKQEQFLFLLPERREIASSIAS